MTHPSGSYARGTIRSLFEDVSRYAHTDRELDLLDLAFRQAFQVHPDYWADFDVSIAEADSARPVDGA